MSQTIKLLLLSVKGHSVQAVSLFFPSLLVYPHIALHYFLSLSLTLSSDYSAWSHLVGAASIKVYMPDKEETESLKHVLRWKLAWDEMKCRLLNTHDSEDWYNATSVIILPCTDTRSLFTISRKCTPPYEHPTLLIVYAHTLYQAHHIQSTRSRQMG